MSGKREGKDGEGELPAGSPLVLAAAAAAAGIPAQSWAAYLLAIEGGRHFHGAFPRTRYTVGKLLIHGVWGAKDVILMSTLIAAVETGILS
jgi:hypothetical protein